MVSCSNQSPPLGSIRFSSESAWMGLSELDQFNLDYLDDQDSDLPLSPESVRSIEYSVVTIWNAGFWRLDQCLR
jgi:hypothetical protein